jgi:ABC-type Fe3+ transport system substrate-binding protein
MMNGGSFPRLAAPAGSQAESPLSREGAEGSRFAVACLAVISTLLLVCSTAHAADSSLYEAAKKEGEVVWYTSLIVNQAVRPLIDAFSKKYPGIEVKYARGDSGPNAIKVIDEARAGKVEGDVFDGIATTPPLLKAGLVENFTPSNADKYPPALRDPDGRWNALVVYFLTPGVNTQLVGKDDIKTAQDLLNPKWHGKIAWSTAPASGAPVYVGSVLRTMGEDKGMEFLRALAKQDIVNVDATNRAVLDQVILGQYAIALSIFNHHAVLSAEKGAPVAWLKVEPIPAPFHSIGLVKNAPHPNAGRLLIDFLLSEAGQRAFADAGYLPALPSVPAATPDVKPEAGGFSADFISPAVMSANIDHWVAIKKELFD